jgi:Periplasmic binding protein
MGANNAGPAAQVAARLLSQRALRCYAWHAQNLIDQRQFAQRGQANREESSMRNFVRIALASSIAAIGLGGPAYAADKIKVGFFSTLEGPYTALGEDGQRGFDLAVMQHNNKAGGKELEIIRGSSDASPDSALRAAKKLVEQDKVDILVAPLSGSEGIALRDYAKTQPQVTIINGCSGALETTYVTPAPNFFRFNIDGSQMHKGLGQYIYDVKKYKKDSNGRGGLFVRIYSGVRSCLGLLPSWRPDHQAHLGAPGNEGFRFRYFRVA